VKTSVVVILRMYSKFEIGMLGEEGKGEASGREQSTFMYVQGHILGIWGNRKLISPKFQSSTALAGSG
jgi:hypothetical protein